MKLEIWQIAAMVLTFSAVQSRGVASVRNCESVFEPVPTLENPVDRAEHLLRMTPEAFKVLLTPNYFRAPRLVVMLGDHASGKTYLSKTALIPLLRAQRVSASYFGTFAILDLLLGGGHNVAMDFGLTRSQVEADRFSIITDQVVVIDDVPTRREDKLARQFLVGLMGKRYSRGLSTVVILRTRPRFQEPSISPLQLYEEVKAVTLAQLDLFHRDVRSKAENWLPRQRMEPQFNPANPVHRPLLVVDFDP